MGVVDELVRARADFERGDWSAAFAGFSGAPGDALGADELDELTVAAELLGHHDDAVMAQQRAFRLRQSAGDRPGALRSAFRLGMLAGTHGETAVFAGWVAKADRLLAEVQADIVEAGYVAFLHLFQHLATGSMPEAAAAVDQAAAIGRRHGDPDLTALATCGQGRIALYSGRVTEGLACLDEAMVSVLAGETSPIIAGHVYCTAIEGCQEISDVARVAEWTSALQRWCDAQPGLLAFTGQCAVHRAQVMRARGAWPQALEELELAGRRYVEVGAPDAAGLACYERGEVLRLRGDHDAADAAYADAADRGFDPQPGLALLWLARGQGATAAATVTRLLDQAPGPVQRCRLLPAAVEILAATGDSARARDHAAELDGLAHEFGVTALLALAATAAGRIELENGDPAGALPYLRKAHQLWQRVEDPYEVARARILTGRALGRLGEQEPARRELEAAREVFRRLGAAHAADEVDRLLAPADLPAGLTAREVEVLRLVAAGHSNAQIAASLVLSEKTVARHLSNIFTKLDVTSRTAAAAFAFEHDLA